MSGENDPAMTSGETVFQWHPEYRGRSLEHVRKDLEVEIGRDQRSYELALQGAEESEHDALASVVDLERRWSTYDFGWHEADPASLARRIADFEWAREQQQEMISWTAYRNSGAPLPSTSRASRDWRASMSDADRRRAASIGAGIVVAVLIILVIVAVAAIL